ncbi:hypothetical protein RND81_10G148200 [Saponaria officinalis]|uniref:Protein kinase domain-containing protein n=1 Tax=Saponaria officinalis TaxID=3572 RepID=A0AAW1I4L4_SAPOF
MKTQIVLCFHIFLTLFQTIHALGSGATLSISYENPTVCAIVVSKMNHFIQCFNQKSYGFILPKISYETISGGRNFFCGLSSGGTNLFCWDTINFSPKRVYYDENLPLREISVGNDHVCGIVNGRNRVYCWRVNKDFDRIVSNLTGFLTISSGIDFTCGILVDDNDKIINSLSNNVTVSGEIKCWGKNSILAKEIENQFRDFEMISINVGGHHVCGFNLNGDLICKGENSSGQLNFPFDLKESSQYSRFALGLDYSCAIKDSDKSVLCWGGRGIYSSNLTKNIEFETLIGGLNLVCGLITRNFSVMCWGPGWYGEGLLINHNLPIQNILPGVCVQSECKCGIVPRSQSLCFGIGNICTFCGVSSLIPPSLPPQSMSLCPQLTDSSPSTRTLKGMSKGLLVFAIVGSTGAFLGICGIIYGLYVCACLGRKKIHNLVQPTIADVGLRGSRRSNSSNSSAPRSLIVNRERSNRLMRLRSGPSSMKYVNRAEEFTIQELALATDDFAVQNKIGDGSFGVVYKGKLDDGREVAIKRGETGRNPNKCRDKRSSFYSELSFLSRVHHKHLVRLVGYCEERDERLLVYEYMKKGALYDHLHCQNYVQEGDCLVINSWKMRIKIALDAARGIEYLHNYAVPPIIHRDIKSSNILLDANWTARVSDFGLSLIPSKPEFKPTSTAGTLGYIDPEYYTMNVLTTKSDVYGFGVVLLELLTGKKAIFKDDNDGGTLVSVVDYAVPAISAGEMMMILDPRVKDTTPNELEAIELVAYITLHCVNLEGKDRPTMRNIVGNLECALNLCEDDSTLYDS